MSSITIELVDGSSSVIDEADWLLSAAADPAPSTLHNNKNAQLKVRRCENRGLLIYALVDGEQTSRLHGHLINADGSGLAKALYDVQTAEGLPHVAVSQCLEQLYVNSLKTQN